MDVLCRLRRLLCHSRIINADTTRMKEREEATMRMTYITGKLTGLLVGTCVERAGCGAVVPALVLSIISVLLLIEVVF